MYQSETQDFFVQFWKIFNQSFFFSLPAGAELKRLRSIEIYLINHLICKTETLIFAVLKSIRRI